MRSATVLRCFVATVFTVTAVSCSSDGGSSAETTSPPTISAVPPSSSTTPPSTSTAATTVDDGTDSASSDPQPTDNEADGPACAPPDTTTPIDASPVGTLGQDYDITSFDGTVIRAHWFPAWAESAGGEPAPTVLMGPGWGSAGDTDVETVGVLGALNISSLSDEGYNVLTWDPRGFGESTGTVTVNSAEYEGRDVQQLLDWVAAQPQAQLDADRDPRAGMVGGSYGGGIQLVTAAIDCRIDAIVPIIAWNSLGTSLFKADTPKTGWAGLLSVAAIGRDLDPTIARTNESAAATGSVDPADVQWFVDRGPGDAVADITVPTLIIQGTVDTLFTLDEAVANYHLLSASGTPVSMLWFCGGHGVCLTGEGDPTRVALAAINWLNRYVQEDTAVDTGPGFEYIDQDGVRFVADAYPETSGEPIVGTGSGTLALTADGGAGPATLPADNTGFLDAFVAPITPGRATNAVDVLIASPAAPSAIVGAPELTITYRGTTVASDRLPRVFAQLVDDTTGVVLGNQITPIEVVLDGERHTTTVPLETLAHTARPGETITLQLVATTVAYAQPQLGGSIEFESISIALPVVTGVTAS